MKMVNTKFKTGGLHEKHVVATWKSREPSQHLLIDTGETKKNLCRDGRSQGPQIYKITNPQKYKY